MDDHFDIGRVFEIGKFDIARLTCNKFRYYTFKKGNNMRTVKAMIRLHYL